MARTSAASLLVVAALAWVMLCACRVVEAQDSSSQVVPRIKDEDLARNDIFDVLRNTMTRNDNPAAMQRVLELLARIEDRLGREQLQADILMSTHRSQFLPVAKKLNDTIKLHEEWIGRADKNLKNIDTFISQRYDDLARIPDRLKAAEGRTEQARVLLSQWVVRRKIEVSRFHERMTNNKETLVGVDNVIDQLGVANKDHFNTTLNKVLNSDSGSSTTTTTTNTTNTTKKETSSSSSAASLLQVLATIPVDNLDEVRVLLGEIKASLHEYQRDIILTEAANEASFNKTQATLLQSFNHTLEEYRGLKLENKTLYERIDHARNMSVRMQAARIPRTHQLALATRRLHKLNNSFTEVVAEYEEAKKERTQQIAQARDARLSVLKRLGGPFEPQPKVPKKPAVGRGIPPNSAVQRPGNTTTHSAATTPNSETPKTTITAPPSPPNVPTTLPAKDKKPDVAQKAQ